MYTKKILAHKTKFFKKYVASRTEEVITRPLLVCLLNSKGHLVKMIAVILMY
jgi:hypothetical protein